MDSWGFALWFPFWGVPSSYYLFFLFWCVFLGVKIGSFFPALVGSSQAIGSYRKSYPTKGFEKNRFHTLDLLPTNCPGIFNSLGWDALVFLESSVGGRSNLYIHIYFLPQKNQQCTAFNVIGPFDSNAITFPVKTMTKQSQIVQREMYPTINQQTLKWKRIKRHHRVSFNFM